MKKLFTSLRHANQTYGSFRQTAHSIMHRAGPAVLAAAVLYRAASGFLFVPLMQQIWSLTLRFAPMHYLNNSNASDIFTSPAIVGCIAAIAVLTAFWALYGFSILLHGLDRARRGETLRLLPLLGDSLRDIAHAWLPQNWLILIYSALLIPFTSFFLASDYITQLAVPEYILGVIRANARYHALYLAGALVLLALWVGGALVLPLFVLERKSLWQAARESFGFVRGRFFRVFLLLTRWNLSVAVGAALRLLAVAVPLYGIILALLYARLQTDTPPEEDALPGSRFSTRKLLAAAVAGATLLTFVLSAVYIILPAGDELRTMLGGTAPIITAHRGYSSAAPENTLPAFQLAIDQGCERAELDVQMTKDGVVMVTHDTSLRRCTGRNTNIYDLTFDEVRKLDAGRWFSAKYAGTKIPTLEEVLDLCKGRIQLNIEIKPNAATPALEAETIRIIEEKGFAHDCVITSQSYETLCKVKELAPEIETGYILALGVGSYYDLPAADFFSVEGTFITSGMVQQIHKRDKTISAWTINRDEDASNMLSLGVDDVITDKPAMVQDLLREDAELDDDLLLIRDAIRDFFAAPDGVDDDSTDEIIEEAIEDPDELLDEA